MDRHRGIPSFDSRSVIILRGIRRGMSLLLRTLKAEEEMGTEGEGRRERGKGRMAVGWRDM